MFKHKIWPLWDAINKKYQQLLKKLRTKEGKHAINKENATQPVNWPNSIFKNNKVAFSKQSTTLKFKITG